MRFHYDAPTDSLYIHFYEGAGADSFEVTEHVVADVDENGRLVGLDIQHASKVSDLGQFFLQGINPVLKIVSE